MTNALSVLMPGFAGPDLPGWLEALLRDGLGGVCLFATNIRSPEQTRRLTDAIRAANPRAVIAVDEEGGDVTRLHHATGSPYPGNALLGRLDDLDTTAEVGRSVARELRAAGIGLNFAPDADVNSDPDNPVIGVRSFGADADLVARHTASWIAAHEAEGVATSAKHFPGHGDTAEDSHLALPTVGADAATLDARDLPPFEAAVRAGARTVMSSHILVPALDDVPATFSRRILGGVLRERLGFEGAIVSDALDMRGASGDLGLAGAAVAAVRGGCDLLCIGTDNTAEQVVALADALERQVGAGRLEEAAERVARLAISLAAPLGDSRDAPRTDPQPGFELARDRVVGAFDVRPGLRIPEDATRVALESAPNIAIGRTPWGLAAAGEGVSVVGPGDPLPGEGPWIVVGRAIHRHGALRAVAGEARRRDPRTIAVDMGWPSPDRAYADIATFGASRLVGRALAALLDGRTGTGSPGPADR